MNKQSQKVAKLVLELVDMEQERVRQVKEDSGPATMAIAAGRARVRLEAKRQVRKGLATLCGEKMATKLVSKLNEIME